MIVVGLIFIVFGIMIKYGKMYSLIAGYNTMTKEQQAEVDIEGIATLFRNVMFGIGMVMIGGYFVGRWIENPVLENILFFGSLMVGFPCLLIMVNSKRYKVKK